MSKAEPAECLQETESIRKTKTKMAVEVLIEMKREATVMVQEVVRLSVDERRSTSFVVGSIGRGININEEGGNGNSTGSIQVKC